jgi:hypothetical protein
LLGVTAPALNTPVDLTADSAGATMAWRHGSRGQDTRMVEFARISDVRSAESCGACRRTAAAIAGDADARYGRQVTHEDIDLIKEISRNMRGGVVLGR